MSLTLGLGLTRNQGSAPPAFLSSVILRAVAADFADGSLVGTGVTLTPVSTSPTLSGDALVFDGTANVLTGAVDFDLNSKAILVCGKATSVDSAQDAILTITGGLGSANLEAQTIGTFKGRMRSAAGYGFGTTLLGPADGLNAVEDLISKRAVFVWKFGTTQAKITAGAYGAATTTMTEIARAITSISIGRNASTVYIGGEFYELMVLDTTDDSVIASAAEYLRSTYTADAAYITALWDGNISNCGDSISVGVGATGSNSWAQQTARNFTASRTNYGIAGAQISPFGLTVGVDDDKIAACWSRVTATAGNFAGNAAAFLYAGTNDYGNSDVPLGTIASTDEDTFYGALNVGWTAFLANAPATMPLFIFTPIYRTDESANGAGLMLEDYRGAIRAWVTAKASARIKLVEMSGSGIGDSDLTDGLHPNDTGHAKITTAATPQIAAYYGISR